MRRIFFILLAIVVISSAFTYFHFSEKEHLRMPVEKVNDLWNHAKPDSAKLQSGDLIFRHGRGAISNGLMALNLREKKYSHVGIIHIENEKVFVYHAIGGEENKTNKLRKDPVEVFCNPNDIHSFAVYRLDLSEDQRKEEDSLSRVYYKSGLEFDTKFDLSTNDKMYCTEFVYKIVSRITGNLNYISLSAFSGMKYIACDNLYLNSHSKFIYSYNY